MKSSAQPAQRTSVREHGEHCTTPDQYLRSKFKKAESKPVEPGPVNPGGGI
ncbi:hypothetical protein [Hafnia psychrotolerans]|uniref:hypothetical protein n=1 Tax=Hafnia psychrotolerans TaxID=1477018 RepID=UPI00402BA061